MLPDSLKDRFNNSQVPIIGANDASIYLLVSAPNKSNITQGSPLLNHIKLGLIEGLQKAKVFEDEISFLESVRVANSLGFVPIEQTNGRSFSREVLDEDIKNLRSNTLKDIDNTKPKAIIAAGDTAAKLISNFELNSSKEGLEYSKDIVFKYNGIPVIFANSVQSALNGAGTYVRRELNKFCGKFIQAKNLINGVDPTDVFKTLKWETIDAFNPEEVNKLFDIFLGHSKLVLDYETSGLNMYRDGFHLGGIGLCSMDGNVSVYVYFHDFFRPYNELSKAPQETYEILHEFFKLKDFVVFNKQYECAVTISSAVGIKYNLRNCEDVLMWLRCLSNSSSLKDACVNRLGVEKWNDAVEEWVDCINEIVKLEKPTKSMKGQRKEIEYMMENCNGLFDIEEFFISEFNLEVLKEIKRISNGKPKILKEIGGNKSDYTIITKFAEENKTRLKSAKEKESLLEDLSKLDLPESFKYRKGKKFFIKKKDQKLLSTIDKLRKVCKRYFNKDNLNEINIKLRDYIYNLLENHEIFEYASFADVPLNIMAPYCIADCIFTARLYHNVKAELEDKNLIEAAKVYDRQGYLGYILSRNGIAWDDKLATELKEDYSKTRIETLRSLITLPSMSKVLKLGANTLLNVKSTTDIEELKAIFNPGSSYKYKGDDSHKTTSIRMSKVIGTPRFKLASLLYDTYEFSKQVDSEIETKKQFPTLWPLFLNLSKKENTSEKIKYLEYILKNAKEILSDKMIKNQREFQIKHKNKSPQEVYTRLKYKSWELESMSHEYTRHLYLIFKEIFGIDPNNDSDWPEEFQALYLFKIYKKVEKSIGTYINGAVGRGSVEIVKSDSVEEESPLRVCGYFDRKIKDDEVYINRTNWGVCTADCLKGDTKIYLVNGSTETIENIANNLKNKVYTTFTIDESGAQVPHPITDAFISGYVNTTIKLTLINGRTIECTPHHRFLLTNGEYKEAQFLTEQDELWEVEL